VSKYFDFDIKYTWQTNGRKKVIVTFILFPNMTCMWLLHCHSYCQFT